MSMLPRAHGVPEDEAADIIERIHQYATRPTSDHVEDNLARLTGLHHILDAATDAFSSGLVEATAKRRGDPGKVSIRRAAHHLRISNSSAQKYRDLGLDRLHRDTTRAEVARALRALREAARLTQVQVDKRTGVKTWRISRIETAFDLPTSQEMDVLLDLYQAPSRERARLRQLVCGGDDLDAEDVA